MEVKESILEKLRKIKALMDRGEAGEAENARIALERLLAANGLTWDDVTDEHRTTREFKYSNEREMALMMQVLVRLFGSKSDIFQTGRFNKQAKEVFLEMTEVEYIDLKNQWEYYRKAWKSYLEKSMKELLSAFVMKFNLYDSTPDEGESRERPDFETLMRIRMMSEGIESAPYAKMIENGKH